MVCKHYNCAIIVLESVHVVGVCNELRRSLGSYMFISVNSYNFSSLSGVVMIDTL